MGEPSVVKGTVPRAYITVLLLWFLDPSVVYSLLLTPRIVAT